MSTRRLGLIKKPSAGGFDFQNALTFDGVDDFVSFGGTSFVTTYTASMWFKYNTLGGIMFGHSTVAKYVGFLKTSTIIQCRMNVNAEFTVPTMSSGTWYHLMVTSDVSSVRLYLNGVESSSGALSAGTQNFQPDRFGRTNINTLDGIMDEVIYKEGYVGTLTNAQDLYNGGAGVASDSILTSPTVYYDCDESDPATILVDKSGNGNDGTLNNFTVPNFTLH